MPPSNGRDPCVQSTFNRRDRRGLVFRLCVLRALCGQASSFESTFNRGGRSERRGLVLALRAPRALRLNVVEGLRVRRSYGGPPKRFCDLRRIRSTRASTPWTVAATAANTQANTPTNDQPVNDASRLSTRA